jgi:hypothetical protein
LFFIEKKIIKMDIGQLKNPYSKDDSKTDTGAFKIGDYDEGMGPSTSQKIGDKQEQDKNQEPGLMDQISNTIKEKTKAISDALSYDSD